MSPRRIGLIADVHGNLHALRAVMDEIGRAGVDAVVCAGDLVGYGPYPNECVELVAGMGAACVAGNHDLMAIDALPVGRSGRLVRESQEWTSGQLSTEVRAYLAALPVKLVVGEVVVAHGSLNDPSKYVVSDAEGRAEIAESARQHPEARTLVLGHTHHRRILSDDGSLAPAPRDGRTFLSSGARYLLNPGSVGQSREWMPPPRARFMVLDLKARQVDCRTVDYDVASCSAALRERGLPPYSMHLLPGRVGRAARYVRDAIYA
jgi:predicted phosphodiesterase